MIQVFDWKALLGSVMGGVWHALDGVNLLAMCYSARVRESLTDLIRRFEASVDWDGFELLFACGRIGPEMTDRTSTLSQKLRTSRRLRSPRQVTNDASFLYNPTISMSGCRQMTFLRRGWR